MAVTIRMRQRPCLVPALAQTVFRVFRVRLTGVQWWLRLARFLAWLLVPDVKQPVVDTLRHLRAAAGLA